MSQARRGRGRRAGPRHRLGQLRRLLPGPLTGICWKWHGIPRTESGRSRWRASVPGYAKPARYVKFCPERTTTAARRWRSMKSLRCATLAMTGWLVCVISNLSSRRVRIRAGRQAPRALNLRPAVERCQRAAEAHADEGDDRLHGPVSSERPPGGLPSVWKHLPTVSPEPWEDLG
jgi:hypothetical protein